MLGSAGTHHRGTYARDSNGAWLDLERVDAVENEAKGAVELTGRREQPEIKRGQDLARERIRRIGGGDSAVEQRLHPGPVKG